MNKKTKSASRISDTIDKIANKDNSSDKKMPTKKNNYGPKIYGKSGKGAA
ncbi:hypothetical protein SAMN05421813_10313 [Daejeonella rubra]|uniref:Uncharacterized protein n=1 Tax=Daejeonella rubra TaxID=990371 RepID=A0A1G9NFL9_9SPHI|nr:hypothetical protein [Daejeonella rubra]SDL85194.1 hypothetical protein SAMN05421813_10313 [Daejeonella rubra]